MCVLLTLFHLRVRKWRKYWYRLKRNWQPNGTCHGFVRLIDADCLRRNQNPAAMARAHPQILSRRSPFKGRALFVAMLDLLQATRAT